MTHRLALLRSSALTHAAAADTGMITTPEAVQAARQAHTSQNANRDPMLRRSADAVWMLEYWDLSDTLVDGVGAMRQSAQLYLPKFPDEDPDSYDHRLKLTKMTNIYRDTVEGLASKPFEQEVSLIEDENAEPPPELAEFIENVDGSGSNLTMFAGATFFNGINSAIDWIFVDYPPADASIKTMADAKKAGRRPYWSHILGRNVLEPKSKVINGRETLTYIRIYEPGAPDHVRVFERDEKTGLVTFKLYQDMPTSPLADMPDGSGSKTQFHEVDSGTLTIDVIPLEPFYTGRRDGRTFKFFPAMRDAADLQVDLYQDESALKWIKMLAGYPMLAGNGIRPEMQADGKTPKKLRVGPNCVLYSVPGPDGKVGAWAFVEPSGTTMKILQDGIKESQQQLRELGRQPLTAQSGNLTVITTAVAANKAKSAVGQWAFQLKNALENAMVITCKFLNVKYDPAVYVYTDFDEFVEGKDIEALRADRDAGDLSQETYWEEMKRRGIYSAEFTAEREKKRLLEEVPADGLDDDVDEPPPRA